MEAWIKYFNYLLKSKDFYMGYLIGVVVMTIAVIIEKIIQ